MKKIITLMLALVLMSLMLTGCFKSTDTAKANADMSAEIDTLYETAQKYMGEKKYTEAIDTYAQIIGKDASQTNAYVLRGDAYYELAQSENTAQNLLAAVADYEYAIGKDVATKDTKLYLCYVGLGEDAAGNNMNVEAYDYYTKAYEIDKTDAYSALMQKLWMFSLETDKLPFCVAFCPDNTAIAFYKGGEIFTDTTFTVSENNVTIKAGTNSFDLLYDAQSGVFTYNGKDVEKVSAKSVFLDSYTAYEGIYDITGELFTQYDMTKYAGERYTNWENYMKFVYAYLESVLSADEIAALSEEQTEWEAEKTATMDSESSMYIGGSMYPMVRADVGCGCIKERAKALIDKILEP